MDTQFRVTRIYRTEENEWAEETADASSWESAVQISRNAELSIIAGFDLYRITVIKCSNYNQNSTTTVIDALGQVAGFVTVAPVPVWLG